MKIHIDFTVKIDPRAYAEEVMGDPDATQAEIRRDIKAKVEGDLMTDLSDQGVLMR